MFSIFSRKKKDKVADKPQTMWHQIQKTEELDELIKQSREKPVVIFKHSTRCGVSSMALNMFNSDLKDSENYHLYILDILSFRDVSTAIGNKFNVFHQSPQLIILRNGKVVYHSSHHAINAGVLEEFV